MQHEINPDFEVLAKAVAIACFRNTHLENIHAGIEPVSKTGDFSDVFVIDADGNKIPWKDVSHISNEDMAILMKETVNKLYTFFVRQNDPEYCTKVLDYAYKFAKSWDKPKLLP